MFGEESLLFLTTANMDSKNRVAIPAKTKVEENDVLALVDNDTYLSIYNINYFESILEQLEELKRNTYTNDTKKLKEIELKMSKICIKILDKVKVQKQHRIILSDIIVNKFSLSNDLYVEGEYDHINIFNSKESYENYKEFVKKRS